MSAGSPSRAFLDTNVLVYADDDSSPAKKAKALELLAEHKRFRTGVVSLQVLQEYFTTATRKYGVDAAAAKRKVELFAAFEVVETGVADVLAAIDLHRLHQFSFWDALVIHSARKAGCRILLSEDLQNGQVIDGVRVVNPFI